MLIALWHLISYPPVLLIRQPDVVYVAGVSYWGFWENAFYIGTAKLLGHRVLLHYLGSFDQFYEPCSILQKRLIRSVMRWPDRVILLSDRVRDLVATFLPIERLRVIRSSVRLSDRRLPNIPRGEEACNILFMGGHDPIRKGIQDIVETMPQVLEQAPCVHYLLAGGDNVQVFEERCCELNIADRVSFLGWIPEEKKWEMYERADILLLPSYNEGLPYVIVEALAAGLPIVASNVGGIPEVISDGENGFIITPGDRQALAERIVELAVAPDVRSSMTQRNRDKAQREYSLDVALRRLEQELISLTTS
jgi:glycosyltransferase involved in cell wall biosynthesis